LYLDTYEVYLNAYKMYFTLLADTCTYKKSATIQNVFEFSELQVTKEQTNK